MSSKPYKILRQGALSAQKVREALAENLNVIGITGGTGSGKTTALNMLKDMGALVLDCDEVYHELLLNNQEMLSEIENNFQGVIINGALDRKALGAIVFNDDRKLAILNTITHKYVDMELQRRLEDFAMSGGTLAAIDAIELFAGNQAKRCKKTVGILAKPEIRAQRIMSRDGISYEYAMLRIQAQHPDSYFENLCDYILRNDESSEEFKQKCSKLFEEIV
jgi:dephospho-CoA kinase